jgi:hypothetical protein
MGKRAWYWKNIHADEISGGLSWLMCKKKAGLELPFTARESLWALNWNICFKENRDVG